MNNKIKILVLSSAAHDSVFVVLLWQGLEGMARYAGQILAPQEKNAILCVLPFQEISL